MSGIYERITNAPETGEAKIPVHEFMAALREVARGNATLTQVANLFALDATAQAEIAAIATKHSTLATDIDRLDFKAQLHDALLLAEAGVYDKATVKARLGF